MQGIVQIQQIIGFVIVLDRAMFLEDSVQHRPMALQAALAPVFVIHFVPIPASQRFATMPVKLQIPISLTVDIAAIFVLYQQMVQRYVAAAHVELPVTPDIV